MDWMGSEWKPLLLQYLKIEGIEGLVSRAKGSGGLRSLFHVCMPPPLFQWHYHYKCHVHSVDTHWLRQIGVMRFNTWATSEWLITGDTDDQMMRIYNTAVINFKSHDSRAKCSNVVMSVCCSLRWLQYTTPSTKNRSSSRIVGLYYVEQSRITIIMQPANTAV